MSQLFIYAGALVALVIVVQRQRVLSRRVRRLERRQANGLRPLNTRHTVTIRSSGLDPTKMARIVDRELKRNNRMSRAGG